MPGEKHTAEMQEFLESKEISCLSIFMNFCTIHLPNHPASPRLTESISWVQ